MLVVNREMALMKRTIRFFIYLHPPPLHHEARTRIHTCVPKRDFLANDVRENIIIIKKKKKKERGEREENVKYWRWKVALIRKSLQF